jgi:hypothetical protein
VYVLKVSVVVTVTSGVLACGSVSGVVAGGCGGPVLTLRGKLSKVQSALSLVSLVPPLDWSGNVTVNVTLSDEGGYGTGGPKSASAHFMVVFRPVNDAPVVSLSGFPLSTDEDLPLWIGMKPHLSICEPV